ncbi:MAG: ECF transporter S component [Oscillospiraceae bacterium]|nr:ECF transporter S component [Oscillospiraceae bacterium]
MSTQTQTKNRQIDTKKLVLAALFSALAYLVSLVFRIPFVPAVSFLKYDAKDVIIALEGFILGPWYSVATSVIVSLIEMVTVSSTGIIGAVMNVLSTLSFVVPATVIYKYNRKVSGAVMGLAVGVLAMTGCMLLWNYFITPLYMGVSREAVAALLLPAFFPFNFIKGLINACLTFILYKPIMTALRHAKVLPASSGSAPKKGTAVAINIAMVAVLACALGIAIWLSTRG